MVIFPFLDEDVPRPTSYGVYIYQFIRFARESSHVTDFNAGNKILTAKLHLNGHRYYKLGKVFFQNFIADILNWFLNSRSD